MNFIIKSKEIKISEDLILYIKKRIGKLKKFLENINSELINAIIEIEKTTGKHKQGQIYQIDINFKFPGKFLRTETRDANLYSAIDKGQEELEIEIQKFKTKKETLFIRGARSVKKLYSLSPMARFRKK